MTATYCSTAHDPNNRCSPRTMETAPFNDFKLNSGLAVLYRSGESADFSRRKLVLAGLSFAVVPFLASCSDRPAARFNSVDVSGVDYARGFELPDTTGRVRTLRDFAGSVVALFFGFTQCPDVCPTTLAKLSAVREQLGRDGRRLNVVLITVDPERDTPPVMQAYMRNFDPSFVALVGARLRFGASPISATQRRTRRVDGGVARQVQKCPVA